MNDFTIALSVTLCVILFPILLYYDIDYNLLLKITLHRIYDVLILLSILLFIVYIFYQIGKNKNIKNGNK